MKNLFKTIIILFLMSAACRGVFSYEIDIKADELEYIQGDNVIRANGNVVMGWQGREVKADYVMFKVEEKTMHASGNVRIEESGNSFAASSIDYDFAQETGDIKDSVVNASIIFMHAKEMTRYKDDAKDAYAIRHVTLSNCDLDDPHTCFRARTGKIVLGERVTIYNPVLYIGKVPIFYLPFITKSLKGGGGFEMGNFKYTFEPGYTNEGGFSIKNTLAYKFSNAITLKGFYDYLGSRGNGYGGEFNYFTNNAKGSIYAYKINDRFANMERWTVRPYYWQRINKEWTIQSQAELISDNSFNNYYNQGDWNRTLNRLYSYAALTRQGQSTNLLIALQRHDNYNGIEYVTEQMSLPQVNFTYYPKKIFLGITHSFNLLYDNNYREYSTGNLFYKNTAAANYNLTKDFRIGKRLTLKPALTISEEWYDRDNQGYYDHTFLTKYTSSLNSRLRVTSWMDWNFNYSARMRAEKNSLAIDSSANDYGLEANHLAYTNYMYIGSRTTVRNTLSYNFMNYRTPYSPSDNNLYRTPQTSSRWSPLATEIIYTPKYYITAYIRQTQLIDPLKFQALQVDLQIGSLEKMYFNFGVFYQYYDDPVMSYRSKEIDNTIGFGLWVTPKWRIDYNIRTTSRLDLTYSRLNDHEFKLYRDLHCYNLGLTWRVRNSYNEVFFKFDMKTNTPFDRRNLEKEMSEDEEIFYPWR
ncbi:LPS-assembly protein LptD [Endomicrobium proavitum]|uniref:Putative OstA-like outer membrane protein n=1 Tax=Endomicrobium proavitum TaxID=1408281 RepID=A0A0G3WJX7_9BACT|nr:OstA-like protein [Endomicrobium proavitum]AKL97809.1 putative OstA-like outer membrane protein [Endomicrobium proavitum]